MLNYFYLEKEKNLKNSTLLGLTCYNHYAFTYLALKYIEKYTPELKTGDARLIVIDNNSIDETKNRILIDFPWIEKFIVSDRDCIPYQQNQFLELLKENEDYCLLPNDICVGPNWLKLLKEDTYRHDNIIFGSPYMNCDLQYDKKINLDWSNNYFKIYNEIREAKSAEDLEFYLNNLYEGDFEEFCLNFQERNINEPPIDGGLTHIMLFKSKLFKEYKFKFNDLDYPKYFGSWEFDLKVELNNMGFYSIASSRAYVNHWISISNKDSDINLSDKQKEIRKNNLKLFKKWEWIPGLTYFSSFPEPSNISNWRTPYHKWKKRELEISDEEAARIPGIKFMNFEGLNPGANYFNQIQSGSILRKDGKSYKVDRISTIDEETEGICAFNERILILSDGTKLCEKKFLEEKWHIDYYYRREEEEYYGHGHQDCLLENK